MEFMTAERYFRKLIDWRDPLFGDVAREWILILRDYGQIAQLNKRASTRFKIPNLWMGYIQQFPKPFIELFDPLNIGLQLDKNQSAIETEVERESEKERKSQAEIRHKTDKRQEPEAETAEPKEEE